MMAAPNPRNCPTCEYGRQIPTDGFYHCSAPVPLFVPVSTPRVVSVSTERCDAHRPQKGTFVRVCLNCGNPIRTHHKYSQINRDQWIHKYCDHPTSPSKYHYEKYGKRHDVKEQPND